MEPSKAPSPALVRVLAVLSRLSTRESLQHGCSLQFKPEDVILSSGVKSGSTWMQQILHGLRSNGDMSFEEISDIVPGIESALDRNLDILGDCKYYPRIFRAHLAYKDCPKSAGKYIVVTRNPIDAAVSAYHFMKNWVFDEKEISIDDFVKCAVENHMPKAAEGEVQLATPQLLHQASWYPHRKDANVLWIHYEDMKQNLTKCIKLVSEFLQLGVGNPELLKLVEEQASLDFMKAHVSKFDSHALRLVRNEAAGLAKNAGLDVTVGKSTAKVRNGKVNGGKDEVSPETAETVNAAWRMTVGTVSGYSSYEQMREGINKELNRSFDKE